jgi:hypothetical protein
MAVRCCAAVMGCAWVWGGLRRAHVVVPDADCSFSVLARLTRSIVA